MESLYPYSSSILEFLLPSQSRAKLIIMLFLTKGLIGYVPIMRQQYWTSHLVIALPTLRQQSCRSLSLCFNFCISFVDWFMASFLYCFTYSYLSSNYCDSNSCRSFTLLKAIAKSKSTHIAIAFKSEKEQRFYLYISLSLLRASKSDNFAIAKLEER